MSIKAKFQLVSPNIAEATITMTATVAYWRELRSQLDQKWPSWEFGGLLADVIRHAEAHFEAGGERTQ